MIDHLRIQNYGCIKDVSLSLSPLHAFIGPNDSGKTTLLDAISCLSIHAFHAGQNQAGPSTPLRQFSSTMNERRSIAPPSILWARLGQDEYRLEVVSDGRVREVLGSAGREQSRERVWGNGPGDGRTDFSPLLGLLPLARQVHLDPKALRAPSPLLSSDQELWFNDESGAGLASIYQGLNSRDVDAFVALRDNLRRFFPSVKNLKVLVDRQKNATLQVELKSGKEISANAMSEGMLYFLAFSALSCLDKRGPILIEEPENGLHPARIAEVVRILREVSKTTQVLLATHSPLVINELQGHEVSVITRTIEGGTQARLLRETFNYEERSRFYSNGELWLMHSDGKEEHDLLFEPAPASFPDGSPSGETRERSAS